METVTRYYKSYNIATILKNAPPNDTRPYVNIKINDITASGLLDSGSAATIIGNNAHHSLLNRGLKLLTDDSINITAASGHTLQSIGYINLPVHFENKFHIMKSYVVPGVQSSLILGIDFWRAFHLCPKYLGSLQLDKIPLIDLNVSTSSISCVNSYDNLDSSQKAIADNVSKTI